jgi:hypothetical protein
VRHLYIYYLQDLQCYPYLKFKKINLKNDFINEKEDKIKAKKSEKKEKFTR